MIARRLNFRIFRSVFIQFSTNAKNSCSFYHGHHLFDEIRHPVIHRGMLDLIRKNRQKEALSLFKRHLREGLMQMDEFSIALAAKACLGNARLGSQLHGFAITTEYMSCISVCNSFMNMYCKSRDLAAALCIFENLKCPDTVSYNTVLSGVVHGEEALIFARGMHSNGIGFDAVTYTSAVTQCTNSRDFGFGYQLHCLVIKCGFKTEIFVGNALVTMYSKFEEIVQAERVFREMPCKDLVSWNAILCGYVQEGSFGFEACLGFVQLVKEGMKPDHVSLTSVIAASGHERNLGFGKQVHAVSLKRGYAKHLSFCNCLISMYSKCSIVEDAILVFKHTIDRDVVSWTTMISIDEEDAVNLFKDMRKHDIYPNEVTFIGLIHAITKYNRMTEGLTLHGLCVKSNFVSEINVANSFINMYGKFKLIENSLKIFDELECRVIISWNSLMSAFCLNELYQEALQVFLAASKELMPNDYTFGSVLHAIASSESISLRQGQRVHGYMRKLGLNGSPVVSGALLDMYAKRGSICESEKLFLELTEKNQFAWTGIISAYSRHGDYISVDNCFNKMLMEGVQPDSVTFLSVLTACGRCGMVDKGLEIFDSMVKDHAIEPFAEHYACIVDMLGRAGRLNEAEDFLSRIPGGPGLSALLSLLGSCKTYGNEEMATRVADALINMEPDRSGSYVLMSNLFAEMGEWEKVSEIRTMMRKRKVMKETGISWADVGHDPTSLHGFSSGDKSHIMSKEIYLMAELLGSEMKRKRESQIDV